MPIYEYRCQKCGSSFEKLRRFAEADEPIECPQCGSKTRDRLMSAFATSGCGAG
ncbi:MAG: zinc ribbon domain-containing protein, partial [Bryobacterales bacterium]|nr:zinc ribbon domain-containing protein [Bryobacterales bacterium]